MQQNKTKKSDENHGASSEEKEALTEIISDNETFFTKVLCFKYILENFESNHKFFESGVDLMENNKMKKTNLLNFAKTRIERIDKGDEFSKMIFKTEKCFWEEFEKNAKNLNDEQVTKTISEILNFCCKYYLKVKDILYTFVMLLSKINLFEENKVPRKSIKEVFTRFNDHWNMFQKILAEYRSHCQNQSVIDALDNTSYYLLSFINYYIGDAKTNYPFLVLRDTNEK